MNKSASHPDEQALFDSALGDPDQLLLESLRTDERRRRRRRWMFVSLLLGGIAMFTAIAALAGWLTLAAPPPSVSPPAAPSVAETASTEAWVTRLKGLRDHMHTAFGVGPDLTLLDPDQGLEIVQQAWPQLKEPAVKTGLLKTFAFSKALDKKHPKLFQVLDLGMHDPDPEIRAYAASYVSEYSQVDFTNDADGYSAWFAKFGDKTPDQVLEEKPAAPAGEMAKPKALPDDPTKKVAPTGADDDVNTLNSTGWQQFYRGDNLEAEATFRKILAEDPKHLAAMNGLGFSLLNQGNAKEARPYFERILALEPNSPGPLNGLARCLKDEGDLDAAIAVWERALKDAPGPNAISAGLGLAYLEKGQKAKAIPLLEMSLKENPSDPSLKAALEKTRAAD